MESDSRNKEIGKDLDHYISARKGSGLFGWFSKKNAPAEAASEATTEAPVEEMPGPAASVNAEPEPASEAAPKKGFFSKWFGKEEQAPAEELVQEPEVDEDLREVARITLSFIKMADTDARARMKSSPDFEKFKEILKRRQVIK